MSIDKIGSINNYNDYSKINKTRKPQNVKASDSVSISQEASSLAENKKIMDIVNSTPDIRTDKVEAAKQNINSSDYVNDQVVDEIADKLLKSFGF
ncbi:MAG: flagellar biosynthesis anti-sigma factor FlgM [Spirochaetes bacterium]|nr:flagellar biosynthesis anti-sigma factor FlgM [Spirochaetota bacterium]